MKAYRRCTECGARFAEDESHCPSCGRFGLEPSDAVRGTRLLKVTGPALAAAAVVLTIPTSSLVGFFGPTPAALVEELILAAGMMPLITYLGWLGWKHRKRDPHAFGPQIALLDARLDALEEDLSATDARLHHARRDLERAQDRRAVRELAEEVRQDERLREAQRKLVKELRRRVETLRVERWLTDLAYFEQARDARRVSPAIVLQLEERVASQQREVQLRKAPRDLWDPALARARGLLRSLSRGVPRLEAAERLDPLEHVAAPRLNERPRLVGHDPALANATESQLERIETSFEVLAELDRELGTVELDDDALDGEDETGVRYRVEELSMDEPDEALVVEGGQRRRRG